MSLHRSLKTQPAALNLHRNVLTRAERITRLMARDRFEAGESPLGLPKVANRRVVTKKKKKKDDDAAEATSGDAS